MLLNSVLFILSALGSTSAAPNAHASAEIDARGGRVGDEHDARNTLSTGTSVLVPNPASNATARQAFTRTLAVTIGVDPKDIDSILDETQAPLLWKVPLNSTQINLIQKEHKVILSVMPDQPLQVGNGPIGNENIGPMVPRASTIRTSDTAEHRLPARSPDAEKNIISQCPANIDLAILSQPWKTKTVGKAKCFDYDAEAGSGSTIYIVDTGMQLSHPEFSNIQKRSIILKNAVQGDFAGHGTCSGSVAAGLNYGTAKKATVVSVETARQQTIYDILYLMNQIRLDIIANDNEGKAVVNISLFWMIPEQYIAIARTFFYSILDLNVPIVTSAGNKVNSKDSRYPKGYPQLYRKDRPGIINIGSTSNVGWISKFSYTGDLVSIYAPGEKIQCANAGYGDRDDTSYSTVMSGTSFAAPRVAGIVAYLQSLFPSRSITPEQMEDILEYLSFPRVTGFFGKPGPLVASNGIMAPPCHLVTGRDTQTSRIQPCLSGRGSFQDRETLVAELTREFFS